jgi:hypothetical protein
MQVKFLIDHLYITSQGSLLKNRRMKNILLLLLAGALSFHSFAQDSTERENTVKKGGFKKDHLFTGGGITLSFSNYGTVLGASPVFGYSINKWLDAGLVFNYIYASQRHFAYYSYDDKLKQTTIGPGAFLRIYPVNFIFLHAQWEKNFIKQKLIPDNSSIPTETYKLSASSLLVGGGYCNGREGVGDIFYYVSVLFDVHKDKNSPYVEQTQSGKINVLPIIRAGIQIPLFQGRSLL